MTVYRLRHSYAASRDGRRFGPWAAGEAVDLDDADADWIGRDSPGALIGTVREAKDAPDPDPDPERQAGPGPNRQAKPGRNRGAP